MASFNEMSMFNTIIFNIPPPSPISFLFDFQFILFILFIYLYLCKHS